MFKKRLLAFFTLAMLIAFNASCSNKSGNDNPSIPLAAPTTLAFTGKDEKIEVSFTRIYPGDLGDPSYEVYIATENDINKATRLGQTRAENETTGLGQAFIYKAIPESEKDKTFRNLEYSALKNSEEYFIFIRASYEGYGFSDYVMVSGRTQPMPAPVKNAKVEAGDKKLYISWDAPSTESAPDYEYAVNFGDCPKNANHLALDFWTPSNKLNKTNHIINLANNDAPSAGKATICIATRNNNGSGAWTLFDGTGNAISPTSSADFPSSQKDFQGVAASAAPAKPEYISTSVARTTASIIFNPMHKGVSSLNDYEICADTDSNCEEVLLTDNETRAVKTGLETGKTYQIYLKAKNSHSSIDGDKVPLTPSPVEVNWANPDFYLGTAMGTFIFAEKVPHSDLARIGQWNAAKGGRDSDRLPYAKETALGNLYADALKWYGDTYFSGGKIDFAILRARAFNGGIENGQNITMRFLAGITNADFIDDEIVVLKVRGNKLINDANKNINLENYPDLQSEAITSSLFGQMAAAYHVAHYGIGATNNGAYFGVPSKEATFEIDYLPYNFKKNITNNENFASSGKCYDLLKNGKADYNYIEDPQGCYKINPYASDSSLKVGLTRGKIRNVRINNVEVDPNQTYTIITTKSMVSSYASLANAEQNTDGIRNITLIRAVGEYIANEAIIAPLLDGRVWQHGGLPTNDNNNFHKRSAEE